MRRVVLLLASSCLAAANAGCAVGVSGTVGMTLDTAGNVGVAAKVSGFAGTTALCFSERSNGRNSETGRVIEPTR